MNNKFLSFFKEELFAGNKYALQESTRMTLQRHKTPVKLMNSGPGGLFFLQGEVPE